METPKKCSTSVTVHAQLGHSELFKYGILPPISARTESDRRCRTERVWLARTDGTKNLTTSNLMATVLSYTGSYAPDNNQQMASIQVSARVAV